MDPKDYRCHATVVVEFASAIFIHPPEGMPGDVPIDHQHYSPDHPIQMYEVPTMLAVADPKQALSPTEEIVHQDPVDRESKLVLFLLLIQLFPRRLLNDRRPLHRSD